MTVLNESRACGVEWKVRAAGLPHPIGAPAANFPSLLFSARQLNSAPESDQFVNNVSATSSHVLLLQPSGEFSSTEKNNIIGSSSSTILVTHRARRTTVRTGVWASRSLYHRLSPLSRWKHDFTATQLISVGGVFRRKIFRSM